MANLSSLQKFILLQGSLTGFGATSKKSLLKYYDKKSNKPDSKDAKNIISKSVDRLIGKGLIVGFGYKTAEKMFISSIKLTPQGKKIVRRLQGVQQKLPFKK